MPPCRKYLVPTLPRVDSVARARRHFRSKYATQPEGNDSWALQPFNEFDAIVLLAMLGWRWSTHPRYRELQLMKRTRPQANPELAISRGVPPTLVCSAHLVISIAPLTNSVFPSLQAAENRGVFGLRNDDDIETDLCDWLCCCFAVRPSRSRVLLSQVSSLFGGECMLGAPQSDNRSNRACDVIALETNGIVVSKQVEAKLDTSSDSNSC